MPTAKTSVSGFVEIWNANHSDSAREWLRDNYLALAATKTQYTSGFPDADLSLVNPSDWTLDFLQNKQGYENQEHQLDLFYDYQRNADAFLSVHEYFRKSQIPLLAIWGKGDPGFVPAGAEAFKRDLSNAAIKTKRWEITMEILVFMEGVGFKM
jgi:pimeloyl-ACP methyl ester carboxylesterase